MPVKPYLRPGCGHPHHRGRRKLKHVTATDGLAEQGSRSGRGSVQAAADQEETFEMQEEKPGDG